MRHPRAIGNRIIVIPDSPEEFTKGGLVIPGSAQEKKRTGKVVSVGPGTKGNRPEVKVDERVLFPMFSGDEIEFNGRKYLVLQDLDVLAIEPPEIKNPAKEFLDQLIGLLNDLGVCADELFNRSGSFRFGDHTFWWEVRKSLKKVDDGAGGTFDHVAGK